MSDEHRPENLEPLELPLETVVQQVIREAVPEEAVERVKARARQLSTGSIAPVRRRIARWPILVGLAVAASLLASVLGGWSLVSSSGGQAFAAMLEKVKDLRTVTFTVTRAYRGQNEIQRCYFEGELARTEPMEGRFVEIANLGQRQLLVLDTQRKLAQVMPIDAQVAQEVANPIEQLRQLTSGDAEKIGEEPIGERPATVYRIRKVHFFAYAGRGEVLVWVDKQSELPVRITIRNQASKASQEIRFDQFVWNEPLDAKLFSMNVPDGYQQGEIYKKAIPQEPAALPAPQENPNYASDGVLSRDRVPARLSWSPDGMTLTALMRNPESNSSQNWQPRELRQWDATTGKLRWSTTIGELDAFAATADGKTLATVNNYEIQLRDAATGKITRTWDSGELVGAFAFSPDGKLLASSIMEWGPHGGKSSKAFGGVKLWDTATGSLVRTIPDEKPTLGVWFSSDGKCLASAPHLNTIKLWATATGSLTRILPGTYAAAFSPTGEWIACQVPPTTTEPNVGRVELYRSQDGSLVKTLVSEPGKSRSGVMNLAFSPDGRLLAAANWNGTVTLWDVASGKPQQMFQDYSAGVVAVAFSPDGTKLATGSEDKTLRVRSLAAELGSGNK